MSDERCLCFASASLHLNNALIWGATRVEQSADVVGNLRRIEASEPFAFLEERSVIE